MEREPEARLKLIQWAQAHRKGVWGKTADCGQAGWHKVNYSTGPEAILEILEVVLGVLEVVLELREVALRGGTPIKVERDFLFLVQ